MTEETRNKLIEMIKLAKDCGAMHIQLVSENTLVKINLFIPKENVSAISELMNSEVL